MNVYSDFIVPAFGRQLFISRRYLYVGYVAATKRIIKDFERILKEAVVVKSS
jgi:hypothetical protein